ncbi:hypothetical protein PRO82_002205 [Candidatus Protochlamydia amoebophila]|nr:hypothetical protein [Candidatus Protochlamydia amoebophila]
MDINGANIELVINLHTCKCYQAVLCPDGKKFHFGYAHKTPDDYVCLFGEADQKKLQDDRDSLMLMIQQKSSLTACEL